MNSNIEEEPAENTFRDNTSNKKTPLIKIKKERKVKKSTKKKGKQEKQEKGDLTEGEGEGETDVEPDDDKNKEVIENTEMVENEVFVYIIHGTMDKDESRLDSEDVLDSRKKYIYDLRYWAWKRLNAELKENQKDVQWNNVNAFFYKHTNDSIWQTMFSPPVYWDPIENSTDLNKKILEAGIFKKYDFSNIELPETNISIIRQIAMNIYNNNTVLLYGFSVGGLVVQRICEILNICIKSEKLSELILGVVLEEEKVDRFKAATFGSIYISPIEQIRDIHIQNYMMLDDVSTRTNFFNFGLGFLVPSFENFDNTIGETGYINNHKGEKLYHYLTYYDSNIIYLRRWIKSWFIYDIEEETSETNFLQYSVRQLKDMYSVHNSKYDLLFNKLLKAHTHMSSKLPFVERLNEENEENRTDENDISEKVLTNIEIVQPINTLEKLIENTLILPPKFYEEGNEYLLEDKRKKRINQKLKNAEEARNKYEKSINDKLNDIEKRDARLARRNAMKDVREEINDISHHTANKILELHTQNSVPIVNAEEPEENMLDFSIIMGQLETKAMYLKGDGLINLRSLTSQAINRGKLNRARIETYGLLLKGGEKNIKS